MRVPLLLLCLLWSLVKVHTQNEYPYISFMGEIIPNHAYMDPSLVGNDYNDSVQCHTDLQTCCSNGQGIHRGDWFLPGSDSRLPFRNENGDVFEVRRQQRVDILRRNNADMLSGIYCCDIATNAVHDDDISVRESVFVGIYANGGNHAAYKYALINALIFWYAKCTCISAYP